MKQDNLLDALQYIDDALLESAADSMAPKKRYAVWFWVTATAACVALLIGTWALLRQETSLPNRGPVLHDGVNIITDPTKSPMLNGPTMGKPNNSMQDVISPIDPTLSDEPDLPENPEPPVEMPDKPADSMPNAPERPDGYRPPPCEELPMEVPKYDNPGFSAEELGELFSGSYGDTIYYDQVGFPEDSLSGLASAPAVDYITIYQSTDREAAKEEVALGVMYDILLRLEGLLGESIPTPKRFNESRWESSLPGYYITMKNYINGITVSCKTGSQYYYSDDPALKINGITLSAKSTDTDQQIMEFVSAVIPYLEEVFDMDLSAYKIFRDYTFSADDSNFAQMTVYLYSKDHVTDRFLEQYDNYPRRYIAGEVLCLNFYQVYGEGECDTVLCREIEFVTQPQRWLKPMEQRKMLTLAEAEDLLDKGYVFCPHFCSICLQEQGAVDFSNYDRVSLEYVYGTECAIPFYTFYKKLGENADGSVRYAKTMVPAVDATGMEEYFESQLQYHQKYPN
jgi:hypothetical protein